MRDQDRHGGLDSQRITALLPYARRSPRSIFGAAIATGARGSGRIPASAAASDPARPSPPIQRSPRGSPPEDGGIDPDAGPCRTRSDRIMIGPLRPGRTSPMTPTVFLAVLLAAALHAGWNALVKGGADKTMSMTAVSLGHVPPALAVLAIAPMPAVDSWPWLLVSAVLHLGYQLFLVQAYRVGDLSQVYPIARGVAPLIVTGVSVGAMGVVLPGTGLAGVLVIASGLIGLGLVRRADGARNGPATALALTTGLFIAAYSLTDGIGARASGSPVAFFAVGAILTALGMATFTALTAPTSLRRLPTAGRAGLLIGGPASFAAYGIVVWAFTQAPIAMVTALRETSIVFALLIGVGLFGERLNLAKLASTTATIAGAALLRAAR